MKKGFSDENSLASSRLPTKVLTLELPPLEVVAGCTFLLFE